MWKTIVKMLIVALIFYIYLGSVHFIFTDTCLDHGGRVVGTFFTPQCEGAEASLNPPLAIALILVLSAIAAYTINGFEDKK